VDHPQALKYTTLKTQVKMHGDILNLRDTGVFKVIYCNAGRW
jgi:hypothetical protein